MKGNGFKATYEKSLLSSFCSPGFKAAFDLSGFLLV